MSRNIDVIRKPTKPELALIELLVNKAGIFMGNDWKTLLKVSPMDDGGMGSLLLFPTGEIEKDRKFSKEVSEFQFKDADGVDVIAALYLDKNGELLELDMWKVNFDKLQALPEHI